MKKPHHFTVMSGVTCNVDNCNKKIKLNLVIRKLNQTSFKCYKHYQKEQYNKRFGGGHKFGKK